MVLLFRVLILVLAAGTVSAADKQEGYYHPEITSHESFVSTLAITSDQGVDRDRRIDFVTTLTASQIAQPDTPRFVVFAKGVEAEKLYLVALDDQIFKTLYRARATLAQMTSKIRGGGFFEGTGLRNQATFLDMLAALGFVSLVVSDGESWAHKIEISKKGPDQ